MKSTADQNIDFDKDSLSSSTAGSDDSNIHQLP